MNKRNFGLVLGILMAGFILAPQSAEAKTVSVKTVEESVRDYFRDMPVMIEIARCESKFRQFNADGSVLFGGAGGGMVGVFQFYDSIHRAAAAALGFDILTLEGNLGYAKHVYATFGTTPWNSAKSCWGNAFTSVSKTQSAKADIAQMQARIKVLKKLVAELQELLEKKKALTLR
jgi:hypothetical protein